MICSFYLSVAAPPLRYTSMLLGRLATKKQQHLLNPLSAVVLVCGWFLCVDGSCVWMVLVCGWFLCVGGSCVWMVLVCGWFLCVGGSCVWMVLVCGWFLCVGGSCSWVVLVCGWFLFVDGSCVWVVLVCGWFLFVDGSLSLPQTECISGTHLLQAAADTSCPDTEPIAPDV